MQGKLPLPIEQILENKHGCFDKEKYDFHIDYEKENYDEILNQILEVIHN